MEKLNQTDYKLILKLENKLQYSFQNKKLLLNAITHRSWIGDTEQHPDYTNHNETLEYLGDSVLDLIISKLIIFINPSFTEGDLTKIRASLVNKNSLAKKAEILALGEVLRLGKGEKRTHGEQKPSILADAFEAVCGALFLDAGFNRTLDLISPLFTEDINTILVNEGTFSSANFGDFKSELQEFTQGKYKLLPIYKFLGSDNKEEPAFHFAVMINNRVIAEGEGTSKKKAQQNAAFKALETLKDDTINWKEKLSGNESNEK